MAVNGSTDSGCEASLANESEVNAKAALRMAVTAGIDIARHTRALGAVGQLL
jgi:hypothetical protein